MNPYNLTPAELVRYAQQYVDRKEPLPLDWQEALVAMLDRLLTYNGQ